MLHGFFDDSGKDSESSNRIVCIAGYVTAGSSIWGAFHEMWKHQLLRHNMEWLHMKDFMNANSTEYAYLNWDWNKKKSVLEDFSAAIKMSQLAGFGVALDAEAWRRLPKEFIKANGTAQEFCFIRILRMVVERMKRSCPDERISILFDCDRTFAPSRFQRYIQVREKVADAARFLNAFTVGEPKVFQPLQAADLLAWETRKDLLRQIEGLDSRPEFQHMMKNLPGFFPDYTAELWTAELLEREFGPFPTNKENAKAD